MPSKRTSLLHVTKAPTDASSEQHWAARDALRDVLSDDLHVAGSDAAAIVDVVLRHPTLLGAAVVEAARIESIIGGMRDGGASATDLTGALIMAGVPSRPSSGFAGKLRRKTPRR